MQDFLQEAWASVQALGGVAVSLLRIVGMVVAAWLLIIMAQLAIRTLRTCLASRSTKQSSTRLLELRLPA